MKLIQMALATIALIFATQTLADSKPTKVTTEFGKVYVAEGFDNNDNVQIVGEGIYSNSCYRNAETIVSVDHRSKTIFVEPMAFKYSGICLQVMIPFDRVIDVGLLQQGNYRIVQKSDRRTLGQIKVANTISQEPDDRMYAPISQALFQSLANQNLIFLTGEFPLSCMRIKEVKFNIQSDVLVVLPLAEIDKSVPCKTGRYGFQTSAEVGAMNPGRYLLHVRSMNGKSINNLFEVR